METTEFVRSLSQNQVVHLSRLLANLGKLGYLIHDKWLYQLITSIDPIELFYWSTKLWKVIDKNMDPKTNQELVELILLKQLQLEVDYGLMELEKLNYLGIYYRYITQQGVVMLYSKEPPERIESRFRIDHQLRDWFFYESQDESQMLLFTGRATLSELIQLDNDQRLIIDEIVVFTGQEIASLHPRKIDITIYKINPSKPDHLPSNLTITTFDEIEAQLFAR